MQKQTQKLEKLVKQVIEFNNGKQKPKKHKKMDPRDRIEALLDKGSPFLELS